ncbi:hypothetical protein [Sphingobium limneticum]|uniref:hypothetical protein n=1 Tax=Sphingobium limneticum TaxID=1007511 RepID=UPI001B878EDA|nr:hypothetical protein [Sphingobium limneticum]
MVTDYLSKTLKWRLIGSSDPFDPLGTRSNADALPVPDPFAALQRIPGIEEK